MVWCNQAGETQAGDKVSAKLTGEPGTRVWDEIRGSGSGCSSRAEVLGSDVVRCLYCAPSSRCVGARCVDADNGVFGSS